MSATTLHAIPWERTPASVPLAVLVLATGLAVTGAVLFPQPPVPAAPTPVLLPLPTPEPVLVEPAPPLAAPEPAPVAAPAVLDARCPPRWTVRFGRGAWATPVGLGDRLARLPAYLAEHPSATVLVLGYADPSGSDRDNEDLSLRRAAAVAASLQRLGVLPARMTVRGIGALTALEGELPTPDAMRRVAVRVRGVAPCPGTPEEVVGP